MSDDENDKEKKSELGQRAADRNCDLELGIYVNKCS